MDALLPSEVARLVWGYLQKECPSAGHVFLKNSPALAEFREAKRLGRRALDTVNGHTLTDLLSDVSDTYNLVTETQSELPPDAQQNIKNKFSLCSKIQALTKYISGVQLPLVPTDQINEIDNEQLSEVDNTERCASPEATTSDLSADILAASPMRALMANLANKLKQNKTIVPFKKRKMTGSPSMNLEATSDASGMAPVEVDPEAIFLPIFKNTLFHEKIAESINKILQPKKSCEDVLSKDLDVAIQQVVSETEKDPSFEDIIQEMCQVTSQAALSDGGSEEIFSTLSLDLGADDQSSPRNELHTPEPTEEADATLTPNQAKKSRLKSTPSRPEGEVPIKARLRSATKVCPRDEESCAETLLELQNEDAVRSIVDAIPELVLAPTQQPPVEEFVTSSIQDDFMSADAGVTLEISLSEEEQQQVSVFNEPVAIQSLSQISEPQGLIVETPIPLPIPPPIEHTAHIVEPPAPILPPVSYHPNPTLPTNPVGSVIIIMDQNEVIKEVTHENVFTRHILPIVPKGPLPSLKAGRKGFCTDKNKMRMVADRNLNLPKKSRKVTTSLLTSTPDMPTPIITVDGQIIHPNESLSVQPESFVPTELQILPNTEPVFVVPPSMVIPESPAFIPPSPVPQSPAVIPPTPSPIAAVPPPGMPIPQYALVSMPSISPAQQALAAARRAGSVPSAKSPLAAESSAERPIEMRKSFSTPRRDSSYVRTLDFSTPPQNKVAARRALTSPKIPKTNMSTTAKHLSTVAKIVRNRLFEKSPEMKLRKSPRGKLPLITEEQPPPPPEVVEKSPVKTNSSWDAQLRSIVGPIEPSPVKRSPAKKRQRIGGPKAKDSPVKDAKPLPNPKETETEPPEPVSAEPPVEEPVNVEPPVEEPRKESKKRPRVSPKTTRSSSKGSGGKKRDRAALRQLNQSPPPTTTSGAEKERLLESLQLSPSKVPQRLPEPTISLGNERMKLVTCEWSGNCVSSNLPPIDRSYVMTISVEADDGGEAEINLSWNCAETWDNQETDDEPQAKRARRDEPIFAPDDDDLMTYALVGSFRSENSPSPTKDFYRHKQGRSPSESSGANPQDMLRKVGVDNLLSALHGKTKK